MFASSSTGDLCDPSEAVMIGDDAKDDIGGAKGAGLRGLLVQTGKYRDGDEAKHGCPPDAVVKDFSGGVDWILEHMSA